MQTSGQGDAPDAPQRRGSPAVCSRGGLLQRMRAVLTAAEAPAWPCSAARPAAAPAAAALAHVKCMAGSHLHNQCSVGMLSVNSANHTMYSYAVNNAFGHGMMILMAHKQAADGPTGCVAS